MLRQMVFVTTPLMGAAIIEKSNDKPKADVIAPEADKSLICRPSDLPFYVKQKAVEKQYHVSASKPSALEEGIRAVRVEVQKVSETVVSQKQVVTDFIDKGKAHSACKR